MPEARFHVAAKQVSGRYALLVWSAKSTRFDAVERADSFVIENGKIVFQIDPLWPYAKRRGDDDDVTEGPQTR
ncbi:hypothetical protein ACWTU6_03745 [Mesorhizobium sp. BHbsci]